MKNPDNQGKQMQITLNQEEIEIALKNYVNEQVNIREGHEINIDLKAGRGENGFSATIDIVPAGVTKPAQPVQKTLPPLPGNPNSKPVATAEPKAPGDSFPGSQPAPQAAQEAVSEAPVTPAPEPAVEETKPAETQPVSQETASTAEAAPTEPKRSLFAGLRKPRNET